MDQNNFSEAKSVPSSSAEFGSVRNGSESFRTVPNGSEAFGTMRKDSERFGTFPQDAERKESHTLTTREVARIFEAAGVARTERSITNWCQPNRSGIARLDAYYDPNERRYYITRQSAELAIEEEKAKAAKEIPSEIFGKVPNASEEAPKQAKLGDEFERGHIKELQQQVFDLQITNKAKDFFIEQLKGEREAFVQERLEYVEKLITANHKVGELETKVSVLCSTSF